jgi:16S rRNA (cytosine1402-N4)-methyltransferase
MEQYAHYPVMYREVLNYFSNCIVENSFVIDCTLGAGGHSRLLLDSFSTIKLIAFERDALMIKRAEEKLNDFKQQCDIIQDNFSELSFYMSGMEKQVSAILYDFGISSFHLDGDQRGFSIKDDSELDMRLDNKADYSAADIVNSFEESKIADIIYKYGEERFSRRIARRIVEKRKQKKIERTTDLAAIVLSAVPAPHGKRNKIHPATKTFQALRIYVNNELDSISRSLDDSWKFCKAGARIAAISFHSLEDRIVKQKFKSLSQGCFCENDAICTCDRIPRVKILTKKPLVPSEEEMSENSRSRSAKMRVCEVL